MKKVDIVFFPMEDSILIYMLLAYFENILGG